MVSARGAASPANQGDRQMTTITMKNEGIFDRIVVNGRKFNADRFEQIEKTGNGKWQGKASGYNFTIIGGKESGGAKNEWFVNWEIDGGNDFTKCKSAIEAINWINKM
jgi:hypothetical protein